MSAPLKASPREVARAHWGEPLPDWIARLAEECEATSQRQAAERIRYSAGLVSNVLRNRYTGDMAGVEEAVRGALMGDTVTCPELGTIPTNDCQIWRRRSRKYSSANSLTVRMFRACARCPVNKAALAAKKEGSS